MNSFQPAQSYELSTSNVLPKSKRVPLKIDGELPLDQALRSMSNETVLALSLSNVNDRKNITLMHIIDLFKFSHLTRFAPMIYFSIPEQSRASARPVFDKWIGFDKKVRNQQAIHGDRHLFLKNVETEFESLLKNLEKWAKKEKQPACQYAIGTAKVRWEADKTLCKTILSSDLTLNSFHSILDRAPEFLKAAEQKAMRQNWFQKILRRPHPMAGFFETGDSTLDESNPTPKVSIPKF